MNASLVKPYYVGLYTLHFQHHARGTQRGSPYFTIENNQIE